MSYKQVAYNKLLNQDLGAGEQVAYKAYMWVGKTRLISKLLIAELRTRI